jgi:UTP--glucose-1-phosphate uridylyltransferase
LKTKRQIRKAIIPAAGLGTRIHSLTEGVPKEMLSIGGRPMIFYAIQEAVLSGLEELYIIINSRKDTLRHYLESEDLQRDIRSEKQGRGCFCPQLTFVEQPIPAGSGDAIYRARELIGDEAFALMMPDFILFGNTPALGQLIPLYERFRCDLVGVLLLHGEEAEGFGNVGIIKGDESEPGIISVLSLSGKVSGPLILRENEHILKAAPRWILGPYFFSYLERTTGDEEWDDTSALQMLCEERDVSGKILKGRGFDLGNPMGYEAAEAFATNLDAGGKR